MPTLLRKSNTGETRHLAAPRRIAKTKPGGHTHEDTVGHQPADWQNVLSRAIQDFAHAHKVCATKSMERLGMSVAQAIIVGLLNDKPNLSQAEIARALGVGKPTIGVSVHKLLQQGLIYMELVPADKRSAKLRLTVRGVQTAAQCASIRKSLNRDILRNIPPDQAERLIQLFRDLAERARAAHVDPMI
jgi:DNA-binding MarR family transcriptional regulator